MAARLPKAKRVIVQAGVNTPNGNATAQGVGYRLASVPMGIAPRNKNWIPGWHIAHPRNNQ